MMDFAPFDGARHDLRTRISTDIGGKKFTINSPPRCHFENWGKGGHQIAKEFNIRFRKAAGSVACPRYRGDDSIRKDKRRHHVMRNAFRPQCCEDREAPVGDFAKNSIKPLSGFYDMLNGTILVI